MASIFGQFFAAYSSNGKKYDQKVVTKDGELEDGLFGRKRRPAADSRC